MSSVRRFDSNCDEETRRIGRELSKELSGIVLLIGELGAGKTTLTKGIVEGFGAASADEVSSPTFTLIHEYGNPVRVYHVDLYRLDTADEVRRVGLEELFDKRVLVVLEWAERFPELLPAERIEIRISHRGEDNRLIEVTGL
jgi:tRNA threonylcarbamoyladenosine biosynthesis protein TsaE